MNEKHHVREVEKRVECALRKKKGPRAHAVLTNEQRTSGKRQEITRV